ncbi:MAG TPA: bifunctional oligoribonuclease/PAP phosphatase NrnA [Candidatus Omnitrophota bacterium]|nr:bifunctional oligoribonuclease/PAP phosphatase NrnA [Candidatus Omnitrophota bacterium]HPS20304.1 bifunctional oligoribonuclease/PAP phosphatase NrnA [Candidatus Omnitrophota bacterium]
MKNNIKEMDRAIREIKRRDNFLITAHVDPEGDSIGSQLAMFYILKKLKKHVIMVDQDHVPESLKFLASASEIRTKFHGEIDPVTAVVLDCPVKERMGNVIDIFNRCEFVINIDHHISNRFFGDVNWVDSSSSSAGEMIYHLAKRMHIRFDKDTAEAVYAAIMTDTGMFNYENTKSDTHMVVADLIKTGVEPILMYKRLYECKSPDQLRLLGRVLSSLTIEECGLVSYISLTRATRKEMGLTNVPTDEFINFPRSVKGSEVAMFFNENATSENTVNVSFRSNGNIDVNAIATKFGGGGHKKASGCLMKGAFEEVKKKILTEVKNVVRNSR